MNGLMPQESFELPGVRLDPDHLFRLRHLPSRVQVSAPLRLAPLPGQIASRRRGHGIEIDEIRAWAPGDDTRHLDRHATARTGVSHVRTFRSERQRTVLLVADFRPSMQFGTKRAFRSVAAAEALALVGWRVIGEGGRVGLLSVGADEPEFVRPSQGERAMATVIAGMTLAHRKALKSRADQEPLLDQFMERATRCLPRGGLLVLATALEYASEGFDRVAHSLAHRDALRVILVTDAFERAPPPGLYPFVTMEGARGQGMVDCNREGAGWDDIRLARLRALGAYTVRLDAEIAPQGNASVLDRLLMS